ncbi:MAG TPA: tyrosine/phenylalanine carboxypeptidase domain-containing protein [Candidatus Peribacteraceae bacterium]|nr:tyrosine/phenylalanine carboxypeptidase domain-containing protein [Candidatus Peribacteraceae bacterium]
MFSFLSSHGVLGLNARNLLYIKPFNPRKATALADNKLKTKAFLAARGIPVAKIYARIENHNQLRQFDFSSLPDVCVLKPNHGFGGEGIMILKGRKNGQFLEQGKHPVSDQKLREHVEDILDGKFSLSGRKDTAFFEKILVPDKCFAPFRPAGLPDLRIVVFNLVPVMAMLRIPTAISGGKANVHQGGIGIGIDIAKGVTTHATQFNRLIDELPHGGSPAGIEIPNWEEILLIASRIQYITNIGYLAVDLTIDAEQGPVLLEVNARAGLMVQVANLAPLRSRLERVKGIKVSTPEKGVRLAQDLFGQKVESREVTEESKPVLGIRETITIAGSGSSIEAPALMSSEHDRTIFSKDLLTELQRIGGTEEPEGDEEGYRVKFQLGGKRIQTLVREGETDSLSVRAVIGRRDLGGFLIDPTREAETPARATVKVDLRAVDKFLSQADHDLLLLKYVKPVNYAEEKLRAQEDERYNPIFQYQPIDIDMQDVEQRLLALDIDDSPLGSLLKKKRRELLQRITVLRARGDSRLFTESSAAMFGSPSSVLLAAATSVLKGRAACDLPSTGDDVLSAEDALPLFEEVLTKYGLHDWQVSIRDHILARVTVGSHYVYLRRDATFAKKGLAGLIAHEIETHVLTGENGNQQPFDLFRRGFANYLDTQEGLAIYNQNRFLTPYHEKRFGPARNILGTAFALEHSFADTRRYLVEELGYEPEKALSKAIDIKRGMIHTEEPGAFTKGIVYFRGLRAIEHFVQEGGDLKRLYVGKIALEDLDIVEQIPGLKPPLLLPEFLREAPPAGTAKKTAKKRAV